MQLAKFVSTEGLWGKGAKGHIVKECAKSLAVECNEQRSVTQHGEAEEEQHFERGTNWVLGNSFNHHDANIVEHVPLQRAVSWQPFEHQYRDSSKASADTKINHHRQVMCNDKALPAR